MNKTAEENTAAEQEGIPNPEEANLDDVLNDPPPQDHDLVAEQAEVDTTGPIDQPISPIATDKPASPAKNTDKPATPIRAVEGKDDDVFTTGFGRTEPSNPVALSKHTAK